MEALSHTTYTHTQKADNHHKKFKRVSQRNLVNLYTYRAHNCRLPVKYCKWNKVLKLISKRDKKIMQLNLQSSPTGPAEHCAGGSLPKSCNS